MASGLVGAAPQPAAAAVPSTLSVTGHGFGHGRGMGQWGAFGYALAGVHYRDILGRFYGGTVAGTVPDAPIGVRLTAFDALDLVVTSGAPFTIGAVPIAAGQAGRLTLRADGRFELFTRAGCGQPDSASAGIVDPVVVSSVAAPGNELAKMLQACQPDGGLRSYRGSLAMVNDAGVARTVNAVTMEQYLRGVVPRESPASWADSGGGLGRQAILAQAVAARSYAWAEGGESGRRYGYAKTCDSQACQVYGGAGLNGAPLEDARTDAAVAATAGEVRRFASGTLARTEYSSSTGGYSAGGDFPAVVDDGDLLSPNHAWSATVATAAVADAFGTGPVQSVAVTSRNGLGEDGGRVKTVRIVGAVATKSVTGAEFRAALGLKSDWFSVAAGPSGTVTWYQRNGHSTGAADTSLFFGESGDNAVACDWDGDGKDTPGVYRSGVWHLRNANSSGGDDIVFSFGEPGDIPVCGDWDGNRKAGVGLYRPSTQTFFLRNDLSTGVPNAIFVLGDPGDFPIVGDWDGDGNASAGVHRGRHGVFHLKNGYRNGVADVAVPFGNPFDIPVTGSWNGGAASTVGVFRAGTFHLRNSNTAGVADVSFGFGNPTGDWPLAGDWDGNGVSSAGVVRVTPG
ncbi:MAG: SpoIID/LytB domain-containing protein [Acidimicrobiia bacterium]